MSAWDPERTAEFFDAYGEQEWLRFENVRTPGPSLATHIEVLEGYVRPGDRVLEAELCEEPGAVSSGQHIVAALRVGERT